MATGGDTRTVEMLQAFLWICEDCGRDNFERAIVLEPESIDPENIPELAGEDADAIREWIAAGIEGAWVKAPDQVRCRHCGAEFIAATE